MSITSKHTGPNKHYDPNLDLTNDQRHRFTRVANKAADLRARKKALYKQEHDVRDVEHDLAEEPSEDRKTDQPSWLRIAIWSAVIGLLWAWILFMTG
ncbi:hypothetical protein QWZ04_06235 [Vibrio tapetis subsp. quintayensis]|uniref:hypothetical protein n=1 Tax=Vibrio tapetis TaxID=52443 RepID=UPI0025B61792|nr:hypothetical protein [Vibrio tapetis]MDN3679925.1 hypothetical protein [Vibrio tapetis subsp. quintayensis]